MANLIQVRELEKLSGFILVDKPAGIGFASVVKAVKRKFNLPKVGHGGSIDTMASGLFVVVLGDANKFADRIANADREYEGVFRQGGTTDTGDIYGRAEECPNPVSPNELRGDIFQTEPRFCSIRKEGSAAYDVVDTGEHSPLMTHVYKLEITDGNFKLKCTARTLVRSLAKEMGVTLESLRRVCMGNFRVEDAIPFSRILEMEMKDLASCVTPVKEALR